MQISAEEFQPGKFSEIEECEHMLSRLEHSTGFRIIQYVDLGKCWLSSVILQGMFHFKVLWSVIISILVRDVQFRIGNHLILSCPYVKYFIYCCHY